MKSYHHNRNPCFAGHCRALMASGALTPLREIKKGDRIIVDESTGETAQVVCMVCTKVEGGEMNLVHLPSMFANQESEGGDGLLVTEYHPIRLDGQWQYPVDVSPSFPRPCDEIYSFVLNSGHVMVIEGYQCVGLGHGFTSDPVVAHAYFGSSRVLEDLARADQSGYAAGRVTLYSRPFVYNSSTELIDGLRAAATLPHHSSCTSLVSK